MTVTWVLAYIGAAAVAAGCVRAIERMEIQPAVEGDRP